MSYGYPPKDPYGQGRQYGQQYGGQYGPQPGPYGPQPGQYGWGPPPPPPNNGAALAALIANCVLTVLCCGIFAIPGIITAAMALNRVHTDPVSAKNLTMWSWIIFGAAIVLSIAAVVVMAALGVFASSDSGTDYYDALAA
ncbi:hypothetical protein [Actinocorallia longicatena]|uniref:Interferon-induced transmembrane protein n=1 Tax=Actinocorallia longicatena TaxID=111803 RepID=A0ABP6Q5I2_9ACTN